MRSKTLTDYISEFAQTLPPGARVLDVGCGLRPYETLFQHCHYWGVEVEESGSTEEGKAADQFFDGVHLPFQDGEYDAVLSTQVLEHCIQPEKLVQEMSRVLKPSGQACITVPFFWGEHQTPYDFRRFTSFGMKKIFSENGFQSVTHFKVKPGVDAIEAVVESEIGHYLAQAPEVGLGAKILRKITNRLWRLLLVLWRRVYSFERIYLDNVVMVQKEGS